MPTRQAIDPLEMPRSILPYLMLTEVLVAGGQRRYRYRLVGTEMVNAAKADMTWRFLDECVPTRDGYRDYMLGLYDSLLREKRPLYSAGDYLAHGEPHRPERSTQRLMLPLGHDGGVTHVLAGQIFIAHTHSDEHPIESGLTFREQTQHFLDID